MRPAPMDLHAALDGVQEKWIVRRTEYQRDGASVLGDRIVTEFLDDLARCLRTEGERLLNLREAAAYSGYDEDHLGRLVRQGKIPNHGHRGRPLVQAGDLPIKPRLLRVWGARGSVSAARQIALAVTTPKQRSA